MRNAKLFAPKNAKNAKDAKAKLVKNSRKILDMVSYTGNKISIRNTYHSICLGELSRKIPHSIHGTACQPRYCPEYRKTIVGIAGSDSGSGSGSLFQIQIPISTNPASVVGTGIRVVIPKSQSRF